MGNQSRTPLCYEGGGTEIVMSDISTENVQKGNIQAAKSDSQFNDLRGATNLKLKRLTYKDLFYRKYSRGKKVGRINGFPMRGGSGATANSREQHCGRLNVFSNKAAQEQRWCNTSESPMMNRKGWQGI